MSDDKTASPLWPADSPAVMAHITLLQGIINRLAGNSASCKTWCLTLTAAFLSLAGGAKQPLIAHVVIVPIVAFAILDVLYLAQERAYRDLYNSVVEKVRARSYALGDVFEARAPLNPMVALSYLWAWTITPVYGVLIAVYALAEYKGWFDLLAPGH